MLPYMNVHTHIVTFYMASTTMKAIRLISRAFREVAALEIWSKRNVGGRKLTIFSAPSARWTDGAEKSSFPLKTGPGLVTTQSLS